MEVDSDEDGGAEDDDLIKAHGAAWGSRTVCRVQKRSSKAATVHGKKCHSSLPYQCSHVA